MTIITSFQTEVYFAVSEKQNTSTYVQVNIQNYFSLQTLVLPIKEYISGSTSGIDWMDSTKLSRETSHIASFTESMQVKNRIRKKQT